MQMGGGPKAARLSKLGDLHKLAGMAQVRGMATRHGMKFPADEAFPPEPQADRTVPNMAFDMQGKVNHMGDGAQPEPGDEAEAAGPELPEGMTEEELRALLGAQ